MLNIIVCIKQVPQSSDVGIDPVTGTLLRGRGGGKMNPYDLYAIEAAVRLKEEHGGRVTAISMGPPMAEEVLWEAIYMGCDRGILLCDMAFAGADVLATAGALSHAISNLNAADIVVCGKQSVDGDTAQVGASLAALLGYSYGGNISHIGGICGGRLCCTSTLDAETYSLELALPSVISVEQGIFTPRLPSYLLKKAADSSAVTLVTADGFDKSAVGQKGSRTQVEKVFPPEKSGAQVFIEGDKAGQKLFDLLHKAKLFV